MNGCHAEEILNFQTSPPAPTAEELLLASAPGFQLWGRQLHRAIDRQVPLGYQDITGFYYGEMPRPKYLRPARK